MPGLKFNLGIKFALGLFSLRVNGALVSDNDQIQRPNYDIYYLPAVILVIVFYVHHLEFQDGYHQDGCRILIYILTLSHSSVSPFQSQRRRNFHFIPLHR